MLALHITAMFIPLSEHIFSYSLGYLQRFRQNILIYQSNIFFRINKMMFIEIYSVHFVNK